MEKYGVLGRDEKCIPLLWLQSDFCFSKAIKEVFNVPGMWLSPCTLPAMIYNMCMHIYMVE
jgi:hypothetical protein